MAPTPEPALADRLAALDWTAAEAALDRQGHCRLPGLLTATECRGLCRQFAEARLFRSTVDMARHGFGEGTYKYFAEPLPALVALARVLLYARLAPIANRMCQALGRPERYPDALAAYRRVCARHGQAKPTPLLLRYQAGGYNRLHRDLYGPLAFPLQATVLLSEPGREFTGGEFLLVENRPRQQAIGQAIALRRGEGIVFAVNERPVAGRRGLLRASVRHGVSPLVCGQRYALGLIFHDAA
ncbi:MAG: proline hydroxylase [Alphaproteobacteria bacterium]|nr:proline hydroxylase [Alphaproteobacteria bacterium]